LANDHILFAASKNPNPLPVAEECMYSVGAGRRRRVSMRSRSALLSFSCLVLLSSVAAVPRGWAQNTSGIFLTPIANAPFTGVILVERTNAPQNGDPVSHLRSIREVARDGQGRIRNVFRALVLDSDNSEPAILRIHFYDPLTRGYTYLYPARKMYVTGTVNHPPAAEPADLLASPARQQRALEPIRQARRSWHSQH
jgi:hypothetical protein